ncbi:septum formation inhibitor Maf [Flavobacteriaceae bacterium F89]|uniref:Septum formation inhibitor Maf n=1 Tax=Cerina litoralis TaxID=2874477 RepID=A0AAE3JQ21_9FLAO|nr:septum formation inhibitor Maf [Cerina litoralis]MCG2461384.1 septum formation inhibitor Maf [Cerina litoralis]
MKSYNSKQFLTLVLFSGFFLALGCKERNEQKTESMGGKNTNAAQKKALSQEFKNYWFAGKAEITSYELEQARYGEMRHGKSVLIFVTEPFLAREQVKADEPHADNVPVLKLNSTKKFITGIYPYSVMSSCFYPLWDNQHAVKVSSSIQEWCGQQYIQLNNRRDFEIESHSYFEGEADQSLSLTKGILEDELWTKIRIDPGDLPKGKLKVIPSLEFIRMNHKEIKAYDATVTLSREGSLSTYKIDYPELQRALKITFSSAFPYTIESWSETAPSGSGPTSKTLTSTSKKIKSITTAYWQENKNSDLFLRDTLGL